MPIKVHQLAKELKILKHNNRTILADCYNANPDSMKAAIEFWNEYETERPHYAILGDMLELGKLTKKLHKNIFEELKKKKYEKLITVGKMSREFNSDMHFEDINKLLASKFIDKIPTNAVVLIKASHGIKLEKIIGRI